jgi:uncharacterized protein
MRSAGPALRLTVHIGSDTRVHHHPLYHEIVLLARDAGLAGATVLHGTEGYGASGFVHTDRLLDAADDLPVSVIIVDTEDRVRAFLPRLAELVGAGVDHLDVILEPVELLLPQAPSRDEAG